MGWGETKVKEEKPKISKEDNLKLIKSRLMKSIYNVPNRLVALFAGQEGTMKSGITLEYINNKLKGTSKFCRYIDLDGGADVLLHHYPDIKDQCKIVNPLKVEKDDDGEWRINYIETFNAIKSDISAIKELYDSGDKDFQILVIDGLSTLLKHAERQMRIEKNISSDGGVQTRYWLERNKHFEEILEFSKSIPIDVIFIAHEDFLRSDEGKDLASIKQKTLALVHQVIEMKKEVEGEHVEFKAKIHKSKYNILAEGKTYVVCTKDEDKFEIDSNKLFSEISMQKKEKKE